MIINTTTDNINITPINYGFISESARIFKNHTNHLSIFIYYALLKNETRI